MPTVLTRRKAINQGLLSFLTALQSARPFQGSVQSTMIKSSHQYSVRKVTFFKINSETSGGSVSMFFWVRCE